MTAANIGSICASMWNRSPGSFGERVVGAKNVARENIGDLLDQADQVRRIARDADDAQLVGLDAQLGHIGVVGQELRQRLEHEHGRRALVLAPLERALRRGREVGAFAAGADRGAAFRDAARELVLARAEVRLASAVDAASETPAPSAGEQQHGDRRTAHARDIERAADRCSNTRIGAAPGPGTSVETVTACAPRAVERLHVAAAPARARSPRPSRRCGPRPPLRGFCQPNAASCALHGVRRSICARTTPSRNSPARLRQFQRPQQEAIRPQHDVRRAAAQHLRDAVRVRAGHAAVRDLHALERPSDGAAPAFCTTKEPSSSSISSTDVRALKRRRARSRLPAATRPSSAQTARRARASRHRAASVARRHRPT